MGESEYARCKEMLAKRRLGAAVNSQGRLRASLVGVQRSLVWDAGEGRCSTLGQRSGIVTDGDPRAPQ